jgi:hypothetical protein
MMVDLYRSFAGALTHKTMFDWHRMSLSGDTSIQVIGGYRRRADAMQVVSGPVHRSSYSRDRLGRGLDSLDATVTREWSDLFETAERDREITAIGERLARRESEKSEFEAGQDRLLSAQEAMDGSPADQRCCTDVPLWQEL